VTVLLVGAFEAALDLFHAEGRNRVEGAKPPEPGALAA
jgi:hypothetical protein